MPDPTPPPAPDNPETPRTEPMTTADIAGGKVESEARAAEDRSFAAEDKPVEDQAPLFADDQAGAMRVRWDSIQAGFVDAPRQAVEQADALVAETLKRMAESFAGERAKLEGQWDRGDDVSTEDLRLVLRRYRSFFSRLLAI